VQIIFKAIEICLQKMFFYDILTRQLKDLPEFFNPLKELGEINVSCIFFEREAVIIFNYIRKCLSLENKCREMLKAVCY
jgi:hypothetical protein